MSVAVTGGAGHVGANLVRSLLEQGRKVKALVHNDTRAFRGLDVELIQGDVLNKDTLLKCFDGVETVFHTAALITIDSLDKKRVFNININGPKNVADACMTCGVKRLVHFSSIHAFCSHPENEFIDEKRTLALEKSHFCYDRSKALGQTEILKAVEKGLDAVIVNPTAVIGPHDFKISRMGNVILDIYHRRLPMLAKGGYNWVDARDIVLGALAAEKKGRTGESYLLSGKWSSFKELSLLISYCTGKKTTRIMAPHWSAKVAAPFSVMAARVSGKKPLFTPMAVRSVKMHRYISHYKATDELDYHPRPLEVTIKDTLDWFKDQGLLEAYAN